MKYKYKNLKHVKLHGMEPYGTGIFDHKIEGGGIELIETIGKESKKSKNDKEENKECDKESV